VTTALKINSVLFPKNCYDVTCAYLSEKRFRSSIPEPPIGIEPMTYALRVFGMVVRARSVACSHTGQPNHMYCFERP